MKILQADPGRSYLKNSDNIKKAIQRVLDSGWYILGNEVTQFEKKFAEYIGSNFVIGVANGTDALELILRGLGIGHGDKVATVGNTAVATVSAIERTGAEPRFADISPDTLTMNPNSLKVLLTKEKGIKAVIVVHLFGCPAELSQLQEITKQYKIPLIEDCAQAHGAAYHGKKCGSFGIAAGFSFYPTKNLGAFGDGGAVVTNDKQLYQKMSALRQYGWTKRYISEFSGINSRLDEIQAAILSEKLPYLDENNSRRRAIAALYNHAFSNCKNLKIPTEPSGCYHVYHQYVIKVDACKRDAFMIFLSHQGIGTAIHYPKPIPCQTAYQNIPQPVSLENTLMINETVISLPMYPELTDEEVDFIINEMLKFFL